MDDDKLTSKQKIELFKSTFKGRADAFGEGVGKCTHQELTDSVILSHLTGKRRIGVYPLSPEILDGSGVYWACVDIDNTNLNLTIEVASRLHQLGVPAYIEKSKKKGFHIWVFFSEPVEAKAARALMRYGLDSDTYEIFPKQTSIRTGNGYGFGNYVNLPLFGVDVAVGKTVFLDIENGCEAYANQWQFLQSIPRVTPEQVADLIEIGELEIGEDIAAETPEESETEDWNDMLPCVAKMMQGVSEGCRDVICFTLAKHFRVEKNLPEAATLAILEAWNRKNEPSLDAKNIEDKVKSAYQGRGGKGYTSFGCDDALIEPFCDRDNCPIFQEHTKKQDKRPKELDLPYFRKNTFIPSRLGNELMDEYPFIYAGEQLHVYREGVYAPIGEDFIRAQCRRKLGEEARVNRINEVIAHVVDLSRVDTETLNTHKHLINVKNGMLNWRSGELLSHSENYLSTIQVPVTYDPNARCDMVDYFLTTTLPADCIYLAEELFGYILIPDTRYHKAFMLTGPGRNGKSTFLNLLEDFVGSGNVSKVPLQEICDHRFKRAEIFGKLVNLFADLDAKALESTTYFKTIVAGDAIDAERKNRDPFFFRPFTRLVYSANEIPTASDRSHAYYSRWIIISFPHEFSGNAADKKMTAKITQPGELSGLLNHALKGLRRLLKQDDFTESQTARDALENYKKANDPVVAFISDMCEFVSDGSVERTKLYDTYVKYCEVEGFKAVSRPACYNRIRAQQGISEKTIDGYPHFSGIKLK